VELLGLLDDVNPSAEGEVMGTGAPARPFTILPPEIVILSPGQSGARTAPMTARVLVDKAGGGLGSSGEIQSPGASLLFMSTIANSPAPSRSQQASAAAPLFQVHSGIAVASDGSPTSHRTVT